MSNDPGRLFFTSSNGELLSGDVTAALLRLAAVAFGLPPESVEVFSLPAGGTSWQEAPTSKLVTVPSSVGGMDLESSTPVAAETVDEVDGAPSNPITVISSIEFPDHTIPAPVADEAAHEGEGGASKPTTEQTAVETPGTRANHPMNIIESRPTEDGGFAQEDRSQTNQMREVRVTPRRVPLEPQAAGPEKETFPVGTEKAATRTGPHATAPVALWPANCPCRDRATPRGAPVAIQRGEQFMNLGQVSLGPAGGAAVKPGAKLEVGEPPPGALVGKKQAALMKAKAVALAEADAKTAKAVERTADEASAAWETAVVKQRQFVGEPEAERARALQAPERTAKARRRDWYDAYAEEGGELEFRLQTGAEVNAVQRRECRKTAAVPAARKARGESRHRDSHRKDQRG